LGAFLPSFPALLFPSLHLPPVHCPFYTALILKDSPARESQLELKTALRRHEKKMNNQKKIEEPREDDLGSVLN
jgi:hypothetical protein